VAGRSVVKNWGAIWRIIARQHTTPIRLAGGADDWWVYRIILSSRDFSYT